MTFEAVYDCIYSAEGESIPTKKGEKVSKFSTSLTHAACFGGIYGRVKEFSKSRVTYHIYLYKDDLPGKNYNLCTKVETKKILRCLQKTVPFTYHFTLGEFKKTNYSKEVVPFYVLNVTIEGNPCQHIWVTSMLRCFFEWPYNVAAKEACELQSNIKEADGIDFSKINWINLYLTIASLLGSTSLHGVVAYHRTPKLRNYNDWKQLFAKAKTNYVYDIVGKNNQAFSQDIRTHSIRSRATYDSEKDRETRVKKYVAAYKDKKSWKK